KRPDWVDLVPAERTLLERLVPRRSTLRSDRRPGNRAASASRSPFLIECQGTGRSFNSPPHPPDSVGGYLKCQVRARLVLRRNCFGVVGPKRARAWLPRRRSDTIQQELSRGRFGVTALQSRAPRVLYLQLKEH